MDNPVELADAKKLGRAKRLEDVPGRYIEFLKAQFPRGMRLGNLRIVVDAANGAAYKIAPAIFWELGADVIRTGDEPDGTNINAKCGATHPEHITSLVKTHQADIGIALDGDADRIQLVDSQGRLYSGDDILAILAHFWQQHGKLLGHGVVSTIMANLGLEHYLSSLNIGLWRTPVGDRYVAEKMTQEGCNLGGESSGHIIMNDYTNTGDGIMTALQILACLCANNKRLDDYANLYEKLPSYHRNLRFQASEHHPLMKEKVQAEITAQQQRLNQKNARLIVRESGTEPVIRLTAEGEDETLLHEVIDSLYDLMAK